MQCKQVITIKLRGYPLGALKYRAAAVSRVVELDMDVLSGLMMGSPGRWLRRCIENQRITQKAGAVFN